MKKTEMSQRLDTLEQCFQNLRDRAKELPAAREALAPALQEVAQALGTVRAAQEAGPSLMNSPARQLEPPQQSEVILDPCEVNIETFPDLLTVIDRDFNIVMSTWPSLEPPAEGERRHHLKCYRIYAHRDRPCEFCQMQEVFATGLPYQREWFEPVELRYKEIYAFPILDAAGRVVLVAEHARDIQERKQAEEALKEREELYRALTEKSLAGVYLIQDDKFRYINQVVAQTFGYTMEEMIEGVNPRDLIHPDDLSILDEQIYQRLKGKVAESHHTLRGVRRDGSIIHVEFLGRKVEYKGRPAILGTLLNITARKKAETALEFQAQLLDLAWDSIIAHDLDGNIVYTNEAASQARGYTREELQGKTILDFIAPGEARQKGLQRLSELQAGKLLDPFESCHVRKDGSRFPIEVHGRFTQVNGKKIFLGVARDIADRKRAEEALRESEERYRTLFETAPYGMCMMDLQLNIIMRNQKGVMLFEPDETGDQPKTGLDYVAPEDRERTLSAFAGLIETGQVRALDVNLLKKDGTRLPSLISASLIRDASGQPQAIIGVAQDISDMKRAQEALATHLEFMRILLDAIPNPIFYKDRQGVYLGCNRAFGELMGITPEEIVGKTVYDIHPKELADKYQQMDWAVLQNRGNQIYEWPLKAADGTLHHVVINKATFPNAKGNVAGLVGNIVDISDLKRAEEAVRENEARLRTIFEHAPVGITMVEPTGRFLQINPAFQTIVGYSAVELQNMTFQQITHPEDLPGNLMLHQELLAGKRQRYALEKRFLRKDGQIVWVNLLVSRLTGAQGELRVLTTSQDITARKHAEEALRESEARFRAVFENAPVGITMVDPTGQFLQTNPAFQTIVGYSAAELQNMTFPQITHPEDLPGNLKLLEEFLANQRQFYSLEKRYLRKDGKIVWVNLMKSRLQNARGEPRIIGTVLDITARKQAEEALRESEQRFRLMAKTIQDVLWICTPSLDTVIYVSPAYEKVWGRSCEELYRSPRSFLEAIHPEDRKQAQAWMMTHQSRGLDFSQEYRIIKPDGSIGWIHNQGFPVKDEQGQVIMYTGVAKDITERKTLEQQLLLAQKMEAVGRLAGGVAHDFNNLLMTIASYAELMRAKILKGDPLYHFLEDILKATDRATALTGQLLTFSRQQIIYPRVVDLNHLVRDLKRLLRRLIPEDIKLEVITAPDLGMVKADPGYLNQIIMNLVINARDAMPCGGCITLETTEVCLKESHRTRSGAVPPGPYVVLKVIDSGIGIDESIQVHIFEPFFTTKEPGKGTGLGLSIVYGITKHSGGFIDLESKPGQGSTFTIYLPRLEDGAELDKTRTSKQRKFQGEETILLVEDEDVLRSLLAKFMRLHGYTVLEARHGDEALLICEQYQGPIQLMVTDVVMPQMSGRVLADRIKSLRPETKVLYMSGYTEDEVVQRGVADLSVSFLQKPFKPIDLAKQVRAVLHPRPRR